MAAWHVVDVGVDVRLCDVTRRALVDALWLDVKLHRWLVGPCDRFQWKLFYAYYCRFLGRGLRARGAGHNNLPFTP